MYEIAVYEDAHESEPTRTYHSDSLTGAMNIASDQANRLPNEGNGFEFGEAGDHELFEIYPVEGRGTVVVASVPSEQYGYNLIRDALKAREAYGKEAIETDEASVIDNAETREIVSALRVIDALQTQIYEAAEYRWRHDDMDEIPDDQERHLRRIFESD